MFRQIFSVKETPFMNFFLWNCKLWNATFGPEMSMHSGSDHLVQANPWIFMKSFTFVTLWVFPKSKNHADFHAMAWPPRCTYRRFPFGEKSSVFAIFYCWHISMTFRILKLILIAAFDHKEGKKPDVLFFHKPGSCWEVARETIYQS